MEEHVKGEVLLVDDEPTAVKVLSAILGTEGFRVHQADGLEQVIALLDSSEPAVDAIITEMKLPGSTGLDILHHVKLNYSDIPVIFLTSFGSIESVVKAVKQGAYHYLVKPPDYRQLKSLLADAVEQGRHETDNPVRQNREADCESLRMLGETPEMKRIYGTVRSVRNSSCSLLIRGETGTGKELIARSLHLSGNRRQFPFVSVNCSANSENLTEQKRAGDQKGSLQRRIESAAGGTLFLDKIEELDAVAQSELLHELQKREFFQPDNNDYNGNGDFRLVASTSLNLRAEVSKGAFCEDLFYRINVVSINVPPLRDRRGDIVSLTHYYLDEFCSKEGKNLSLSKNVIEALQAYSWPGNVWELKNVVERVVALADKRKISVDDLPGNVPSGNRSCLPLEEPLKTLKEMEIDAVKHALRYCGGNKSRAAKMLGLSRKTFYKRLQEAGPAFK